MTTLLFSSLLFSSLLFSSYLFCSLLFSSLLFCSLLCLLLFFSSLRPPQTHFTSTSLHLISLLPSAPVSSLSPPDLFPLPCSLLVSSLVLRSLIRRRDALASSLLVSSLSLSFLLSSLLSLLSPALPLTVRSSVLHLSPLPLLFFPRLVFLCLLTAEAGREAA